MASHLVHALTQLPDILVHQLPKGVDGNLHQYSMVSGPIFSFTNVAAHPQLESLDQPIQLNVSMHHANDRAIAYPTHDSGFHHHHQYRKGFHVHKHARVLVGREEGMLI